MYRFCLFSGTKLRPKIVHNLHKFVWTMGLKGFGCWQIVINSRGFDYRQLHLEPSPDRWGFFVLHIRGNNRRNCRVMDLSWVIIAIFWIWCNCLQFVIGYSRWDFDFPPLLSVIVDRIAESGAIVDYGRCATLPSKAVKTAFFRVLLADVSICLPCVINRAWTRIPG